MHNKSIYSGVLISLLFSFVHAQSLVVPVVESQSSIASFFQNCISFLLPQSNFPARSSSNSTPVKHSNIQSARARATQQLLSLLQAKRMDQAKKVITSWQILRQDVQQVVALMRDESFLKHVLSLDLDGEDPQKLYSLVPLLCRHGWHEGVWALQEFLRDRMIYQASLSYWADGLEEAVIQNRTALVQEMIQYPDSRNWFYDAWKGSINQGKKFPILQKLVRSAVQTGNSGMLLFLLWSGVPHDAVIFDTPPLKAAEIEMKRLRALGQHAKAQQIQCAARRLELYTTYKPGIVSLIILEKSFEGSQKQKLHDFLVMLFNVCPAFASRHVRGPRGDTVLHAACRAGDLQLHNLILSIDPELARIKNDEGQIPLVVALGENYFVTEDCNSLEEFRELINSPIVEEDIVMFSKSIVGSYVVKALEESVSYDEVF